MEGEQTDGAVRVSIGLPVYNGERYLRAALDSLLAQTYRRFELIISDNGSTDGTEAICRAYAAADPRIRYYREEVNRGGAWNFNRVYSLARGEYFKWAAHDDLCAPRFIERCVEELDRHPTAVLCHPRTTIIDEHGSTIEQDRVTLRTGSAQAHQRFEDLIRVYHGCYQQSGLIRADALRRTRLIANYAASDRVLLARLALLGPFLEVPEHLFFSRRHQEQSLNLTRFERTAWFDPTKAGRIVFPEWQLFFEHFNCTRGVALGARERALCYLCAVCWPAWHRNWRAMGVDLVRAALYMVRRALPGRARTGAC